MSNDKKKLSSNKNKCQNCRECCKFEKDEAYFAPLFTKAEIAKIKSKNHHPSVANAIFKPYKNSDKVFQIELVKSKNTIKPTNKIKPKNKVKSRTSAPLLVCPFLNEDTHLCRVYRERNLDCRLWPFIFMRGKKQEVILAHFDRDMCPIWNEMKEDEFSKLKKKFLSSLKKEKIIPVIKAHPELVWEYEKYTNTMLKFDFPDE